MSAVIIPVARSRVCPPCAVTWRSDRADACWACGAPGLYTAEVVITSDGRVLSLTQPNAKETQS